MQIFVLEHIFFLNDTYLVLCFLPGSAGIFVNTNLNDIQKRKKIYASSFEGLCSWAEGFSSSIKAFNVDLRRTFTLFVLQEIYLIINYEYA
jgi:hypothetical protein